MRRDAAPLSFDASKAAGSAGQGTVIAFVLVIVW
jgi:hypothetical protein